MNKKLAKQELLFEITSVLGKKVRTHRSYWQEIKTNKHPESEFKLRDLKLTISDTDTVYQSRHSKTIFLYCKRFERYSIIAVVRHLNNDGFLVTSYQTTKSTKARKIIWQK